MSKKLSNILAEACGGLSLWCEPCGHLHTFHVEQPNSNGAVWLYNNNPDKPTFTPSWVWKTENGHVCHFFVTDGKISYLNDCSHELKGQTVELYPLPDWLS